MIHVQIASQITSQGVHGVRWVLVETVDAQQALQPAPAVALAAQVVPAALPEVAPAPVADAVRLGALKLLVIGLGLGAALWTAAVQVGPPALPGLAPARPAAQGAATVPHQALPMHGTPPADPAASPGQRQPPEALPVAPPTSAPAPAPAPAASAVLPRLTAAL